MRGVFGKSKKAISKMFAVFKKSVCTVREQIGQGVRFWMWLLQLDLPFLSGGNNGPRLPGQ